MQIQQAYERWRANVTDPDLAHELATIAQAPDAIAERFAQSLSFGTGGLRGILGVGTNRMNIHTVGKATQGYANHLNARHAAPSVAITYDSRMQSQRLAEIAAGIFAANGIQVYLSGTLMPTPALSFAVRHLRCDGGVVITASHNAAQYNGYKVYGADGCQVTDVAAQAIERQIQTVDPFDDVACVPLSEGLAGGRIAYWQDSVRDAYLAAVSAQSLQAVQAGHDFAIVYTPLHGTGIRCVPDCLRRNGFLDVRIPPSQMEPDGRFPTSPSPNPEEREALSVGIELASATGAALVLATDPDCDRVGVAVRTGDTYTLLSGNQMGVLLLDFICRKRLENGTMPKAPVAIKTIVTTPMAEPIAAHYGVALRNVLTGFKYIGEQIGQLEAAHQAQRFIFGLEESNGYLCGTYARDKDAVLASLLICEMAADYGRDGKTLVDGLDALYRRFGYYGERLISFAFTGADGPQTMQAFMTDLRHAPPATLAGVKVTMTEDYQASMRMYADDRPPESMDLPPSNVLRFGLADGGTVVIRPSGTEPKLKVYLMVRGASPEDNTQRLAALAQHFADQIA